ncbi:MAG: hypothetical protein ACXWQE_00010 [Bdellovibrionales bacterium]
MASFLSLLPLILNLLGMALKWYGAGDQVLEDYKKLVESTQNSGLITIDAKDKLLSQREKILARQKKPAP